MTTYNLAASQITRKDVKTSEYAADTVIAQSPEAGNSYQSGKGKQITLTVAVSDSVAMPNVSEDTVANAISVLTSLGIDESRIVFYQPDYTSATGYSEVSTPSSSRLVQWQSPYYGEMMSLSDDGQIILYLQANVTATTYQEASTTESSVVVNTESVVEVGDTSSSSSSTTESSSSTPESSEAVPEEASQTETESSESDDE